MVTVERLQVEYEAKTARAERDAARFAATQRDVAASMRESEKSSRDADGGMRALGGRLSATGDDADDMAGKTGRLSRAIRGMSGESRDLSSALGAIAFPGAVAGLSGLAATAQSAGGALVALGAASAPLAGLAGAIPQLGGAAVQGFAVAKLATMGFGDALEALNSGDVDKITEAMRNLSPQAQAAARNIMSLKPAFESVRQATQENIFRAVNGAITNLRVFLPNVRQAIIGTSQSIAGMITELSTLAAGRWRTDINSFLATNTRLVGMGVRAGINFADAFRNIVASAQPLALWLGRLAVNLSSTAQQFIANQRASGGLARFFEATRVTTARFLSILGSVGGIFLGIGRAAFSSGQSMLGSIDAVLRKWSQWVNSARGQEQLNRFFDNSRVILSFMAGVVGDLAAKAAIAAGAFGQLSGSVARLLQSNPQLARLAGLVTGLGAGLAVLSRTGALATFVAGWGRLAAIVPLLNPVSAVVAAIGAAAVLAYRNFEPFRVVVNSVAATIARNVVPAFRSFVGFIMGSVVPAVRGALFGAISSMMPAIRGLVGAFSNNREQFLAFGRVILEVGKWLGVTLLPIIIRVAGWLAGQLIRNVTATINIFAWLVRGVQAVVGVFTSVFGAIPRIISGFVSAVTSGVTAVIGFFSRLGSSVSGGMRSFGTSVSSGVQSVVNFFVALPGRVGAALTALPGLLLRLGQNALGMFLTAVKAGIRGVLVAVIAVPMLIIGAMIALPQLLFALGQRAWTQFRDISTRMVAQFITWATGIPQRAYNATVRTIERLRTMGSQAWTAFQTVSTNMVIKFITWATGIPQRAYNAVVRTIERLRTLASQAWTAFQVMSATMAVRFITWATGLPQRTFNAVSRLPERLRTTASNAWSAFMATSRSWWDRALNFFRSLPGAAANAMRAFGSRITGVIRGAFNSAAGLFNKFMGGIESIGNKLGAKLSLPRIGGFAGGGPVASGVSIASRGQTPTTGGRAFAAGGEVTAPISRARGGGIPLNRGVRGRDSVHAIVTPGEYVMTPEMVDQFPGGMRKLEAWRAASNRRYTAQRRINGAIDLPGEAVGGRIVPPVAVGGRVAGLVPSFLAALRAYSSGIGRNLTVNSGFRSRAQQAALYAAKPGLAAPPGRSNHEKGLAADISPQLGGTALGNPAANRYGLRYPMSYEPWHIEPSNLGGARRGILGSLLSLINPAPLLRKLSDPIIGALGRLPGVAGPIAAGGGRKIRDAALDKLNSFFDPTGGGAGGGGLGGNPGANRALGQSMAAARGWTGTQWTALDRLVMKESGWRNTAQNPTSTAYGIFQFLNSTWGGVGARKTSDPRAQIAAGLTYIGRRYGTPSGALAFHNRNNWYSAGGPVGAVSMATGGLLGPTGVATRSLTHTDNYNSIKGFLGNAMVRGRRGFFQASELDRVMGAYNLRHDAAPLPKGGMTRRWLWGPQTAGSTFHTQDLRDPNRGKAGYIQSAFGYWSKASAKQVSSRENAYRVHMARRRAGSKRYSATGVQMYTAGGMVPGGTARASYAGGGPVGGTYGAMASYMPGGAGSTTSSSTSRTVNMAPNMINLQIHAGGGSADEIGHVVSEQVGAALNNLVAALNARGG